MNAAARRWHRRRMLVEGIKAAAEFLIVFAVVFVLPLCIYLGGGQ